MAYDRLFLVCAACREATVLATFQAMVGNVVKDRNPLDAFVQEHLDRHDAWPAQQDWGATPPFVLLSEGSSEPFTWVRG